MSAYPLTYVQCYVPILYVSLNTQENVKGNKLGAQKCFYIILSFQSLQQSQIWDKTKPRVGTTPKVKGEERAFHTP